MQQEEEGGAGGMERGWGVHAWGTREAHNVELDLPGRKDLLHWRAGRQKR